MSDIRMVASVEAIRQSFPALERIHNDHPVAYFDGPGGTQVPRQVVEAVSEYLLHHNANQHWAYPTSIETDAVFTLARRAVADLLNGRPEEIAFGPNMTSLTYHLSRALGRGYGPGDEIVITELDHHANIGPWQALEQERGITLKMVRFDTGTGRLDFSDLEDKLGPNTRLLAIGAASNALGTITDVTRATAMAHSAGARVFVDAVHYVPHVLADVQAIGCDYLACSAYKFYGPHVGILWGRHDLLQELDVPKLQPAPNEAPARFETGTQIHEGVAGTAAIVDFLAVLGPGDSRRERLSATYEALHQRSTTLITRLWDGLQQIDGVTLYGPEPGTPRTPTLSFTVAGTESREVVALLAEKGLFLTHGDFYAMTVVERLGKADEGLVRAGCACYTTEREIERLIEAVADLV